LSLGRSLSEETFAQILECGPRLEQLGFYLRLRTETSEQQQQQQQ
jgi:hypothetical protein